MGQLTLSIYFDCAIFNSDVINYQRVGGFFHDLEATDVQTVRTQTSGKSSFYFCSWGMKSLKKVREQPDEDMSGGFCKGLWARIFNISHHVPAGVVAESPERGFKFFDIRGRGGGKAILVGLSWTWAVKLKRLGAAKTIRLFSKGAPSGPVSTGIQMWQLLVPAQGLSAARILHGGF